eukprot:CAMPEP_0117670614 /NCGR_PEP_ID=MMETSP0804-20121206/12866_1 /TAXON_ID=1074897 /ORGANISM="Tetraselmis astigmatica, Strain CCMP880" /LENGTH=454 /DNA_ID=CAMNT_0005478963 /DNA_START=166 /DNA_END=1526 /DNA_ORIENTATION=+
MADSCGDIRVVIEGCGHGELEKIYQTVADMEKAQGFKIDMVICCGDFQSTRNYDDLETMSCPPKYRHIQTFYKYYSGEKVAPYLTVFIGGNHEAANYLWELYHGGWVAPNIYFLGYAGVLNFGKLRIGGISGIFQEHHYKLGHYEAPPYNPKSIKSAYHIRELEVLRLMQVKGRLDVFLSHDWPRGVYNHGNREQLLRKKPFFRKEVEQNLLGSPVGEALMAALQPDYWFSAHLHVKHAALVTHPPGPKHPCGSVTKFLSLDKCLPGRDFLQLIHFPGARGEAPLKLEYDAEWLAVLRCTHGMLSTSYQSPPLRAPSQGQLQGHLEFTRRLLTEKGAAIPENFCQTAPPVPPGSPAMRGHMPSKAWKNPQTVQLLEMLGLDYNLAPGSAGNSAPQSRKPVASVGNPEEIDIGSDDDGDDGEEEAMLPVENPEEIDIGENDDEEGMFGAVEIYGS